MFVKAVSCHSSVPSKLIELEDIRDVQSFGDHVLDKRVGLVSVSRFF